MEKRTRQYNLKITPSHSVLYRKPRPKGSRYTNPYQQTYSLKTAAQLENEKNLKQNEHKGFLSDKAVKRLKTSLNWFIASAQVRKIYDNRNNRYINFKLAFVTLTLPAEQGELSDNYIKKEVLNPFLILLKNRYSLNNYIWKAEAQENGNIHFHIVVDCYIPYDELRFLWNRLLNKKGLMAQYTTKFFNMSLEEYRRETDPGKKVDFNVIKKRFLYGKQTEWKNPNTTDIHSIRKVKDLAAYLATYMSKKDLEKRGIVGRIWSCSYPLSDKNKCVIELDDNELFSKIDLLNEESEKIIIIDNGAEAPEDLFWVATVFVMAHKKIINSSISWLKKAYTKHLKDIRQERQTLAFN